MTAQIKSIKRLRIVCKTCKSEFITSLGNSIEVCTFCGTNFDISLNDNPFIKINKALHYLKMVQNADISLLCEDD